MPNIEKYRQPDGSFDFRHLNLSEARLKNMDCRGANFTRVQLHWNQKPSWGEKGFKFRPAVFESLDLREAKFNESALNKATFYQCRLNRARFDRADLTGVQFTDCDLSEAIFDDALGRAAFKNCQLIQTNFTGMDAEEVSFLDSNLAEADFYEIKASLYKVLSRAEDAIPSIVESVKKGSFNGNNYFRPPDSYGPSGFCLLGHIAQHRGVNFWELDGIPATGCSPIERWLMGIFAEDTPETNPVSQLLLDWIDLYLLDRSVGFSL